jgi:hypothetical protein
MRLPHRGTKAARLHDEHGLYLETRLQGNPQCDDLSAKWTAAQDRLRAAMKACTDAKIAAMRALAVRDTADDVLGTQVRLLHRTIAALVKNNHSSELFQTYFPQGSPAVTEAQPRQEMGQVETILAKLQNETEPFLQAHVQPLGAALDACRSAVEAHEAAVQAAKTAVGLEQTARIQWFDDYEILYHDLSSRFVRDPSRAETYFRPTNRRRQKNGQEPKPAVVPVQAVPAPVVAVTPNAPVPVVPASEVTPTDRTGTEG